MYSPYRYARCFVHALTLCASCFFLIGAGEVLTTFSALADDHVVLERVRTGLGMRSPARSTDIWLNETGVAIMAGRSITIERYDLKKRWTIAPLTRRYFEEPLTPRVEEKKDTSIQRAGWHDSPTYDWTVSENQRRDTVSSLPCRLIVAEGDADYSSEFIELWVAETPPVDCVRFNERVTAGTADFDWRGLLKAYPSLQRCLIMKVIDKRSGSIAPDMIYETKITRIETATSPEKTYEIPEGFKKVNSMDELFN